MFRCLSFALTVLLMFAPSLLGSEFGQKNSGKGNDLRYVVDLTDAANRYVHIELTFSPQGKQSELMMAVWTPGSYLVREYARHLDSLEVVDEQGNALPVRKTRKNRWMIENGMATEIKVGYRLYCNEESVRTNFVNGEYAVLNGAPTFLTLPQRLAQPHQVKLEMPATWKRSATSLTEVDPHQYSAKNFDELVDSPIVAGNLQIYPFKAGDVEHQLVNVGEKGLWDGVQAAADLKKVVEAHQEMWGNIPYERYLFLNVLSGGGGGLEHDNSTLVLSSIWNYRDKSKYQKWLSLCSHEFFHTWNVRRLRPKPLVNYDYETEIYTDGLWIAEGITSYYQDLALVRCGLMDQEKFLSNISGDVKDVQGRWGRKVQSLRDSSFDTWIKFYRPDENSDFTRISYYKKGAVVAFLLDMKIRQSTKNKKCLDDVMRKMFQKYAKSGYTSKDFRKTASKIAGTDLTKWFALTIDSTDELPYDEAMGFMGILPPKGLQTSKAGQNDDNDQESSDASPGKPDFGAEVSGSTISRVTPQSQAYRLGLLADDEILAVNGLRLNGSFGRRIRQYDIGDKIELLLSRDDQLFSETVTLERSDAQDWAIRWDPTANDKVLMRVREWLNLPEPEKQGTAGPEDSEKPEVSKKKKRKRKRP